MLESGSFYEERIGKRLNKYDRYRNRHCDYVEKYVCLHFTPDNKIILLFSFVFILSPFAGWKKYPS